MGIFIAAVLFLFITGVIVAFGYRHYVRPAQLIDQLTASTSEALPTLIVESKKGQQSGLAEMFASIGSMVPVSPQDANVAKKELSAAGFRSSSAVTVYYGTKFAAAAVFVLLGAALRSHVANPVLKVVMPIASGAAGYALPAFILGRKLKTRQENIRFGLPDALDLMVICTEAGCGLDQAIMNVSRDMKSVHPEIADELGLLNMEVMAGKSRADALRNLARRTGEEELKKLVAILIQTDRFGTSVAEALRTQSDFLRIRRRQEAEERAGKVGVKLVFPIFFFCMPSLVVVTAGPGMLQLFTNLLPAMAHANMH